MRDRGRELRWTAATGAGILGLLLLPFEFFDVIAVGLSAWLLWWMWTVPPRSIRAGSGPVPWSPVVFSAAGVVVAVLLGRALARPGFVMATVLLAAASATGLVRAVASPLRGDDR